jgi:hypothetical protein
MGPERRCHTNADLVSDARAEIAKLQACGSK